MSPDARRTKRPRTRDYDVAGSPPGASSTRPESRRAGQSMSSAFRGGRWAQSPYLGYLLLVGVGIASLRLTHPVRLTMMWLVELVLVLLYAQSGKLKSNYSLSNLGRGLLVGIVVSLPLYLSAPNFFYATASWLYGVKDLQVLLERAVFIVPLLEGLYFRGAMQRERGLSQAALLFGLAQALYVLSAVNVFPLVIFAVMLGMVLIGLLYGFMFKRYGLTASIACQVAVSFMLFVFPALAAQVSGWLV